MNETATNNSGVTPMLFPYQPEQFWAALRQVIREEVKQLERQPTSTSLETPGLTYKPLFKMAEVCALFQVSKPTLYEWIRHG